MIDPVNPSPKDPPKDPKRKPPTPGGGDLPPVWRGLLWYIPVLLFLLWFWQYLFSSMSVETIPYSQFKQYLAQGEVKDCDVEQDEIIGTIAPKGPAATSKTNATPAEKKTPAEKGTPPKTPTEKRPPQKQAPEKQAPEKQPPPEKTPAEKRRRKRRLPVPP